MHGAKLDGNVRQVREMLQVGMHVSRLEQGAIKEGVLRQRADEAETRHQDKEKNVIARMQRDSRGNRATVLPLPPERRDCSRLQGMLSNSRRRSSCVQDDSFFEQSSQGGETFDMSAELGMTIA